MAEIKPFKGVRYTEKAGNLQELISPLFDVVSNKEIEQLFRLPYNSIHLSFPQTSGSENVVDTWIQNGILRVDTTPAIYVYAQTFTLPDTNETFTRTGFICNLRLYDWQQGVVLKHESTMDFSVEDRVEVLEKTALHSSPVHLLYSDPDFVLKNNIEDALKSPISESIDSQGTINRLAIIEDPGIIEKFVTTLSHKNLILADGHHRYTAGLQFLSKQKVKDKGYSPDKPYNFIMAYLTNIESEAIKILPTHRVIKNIPEFEEKSFVDKIKYYFQIQKLKDPYEVSKLLKNSKKHAFGLIMKNEVFLIELKPGLEKTIHWSFPEVVKNLDLTVLHYFIIEKVLNIKGKDQKNSRNIEFSAIFTKCIREITEGLAQLAVITRDIEMDEVKKVCFSGHTFPQKSTYFYPKVTSGLVFSSITHS
ncbi:MAG TPA: DUF1015 domain-containing protein [Cytophagaceae bacterium]